MSARRSPLRMLVASDREHRLAQEFDSASHRLHSLRSELSMSSGSAELPAVAVCLDARVTVRDATKTRTIASPSSS